MVARKQYCLLLMVIQLLVVASEASSLDSAVMEALKDIWQNTPPNWVNGDPCGNGWEGVGCTNNRVTSITLPSMGLAGQLSGDIASLSELQTLDLSYNKGLTGPLPPSIGSLKKLSNLILIGCSFSGPLPATIGSLNQLVFLSLNSNKFSGSIPPSIGSLSKLFWLDLADNQLGGIIPVSNGTTPGLDMLLEAKHFHLGKNQLSGIIPSQLFSSGMTLLHLLLDGNKLSGRIPSTIGLVQSFEVIRLDRNSLSGPVPSSLNNLTQISELHLSKNKLTGAVPDLTGMNLLSYVDMSNNSFDVSEIPRWFTTLQSLTTVMMDRTQLQGQVPTALFSLPHLQTLVLSNNQLNGTLDIGASYSSELRLVDLRKNFITGFTQRAGLNISFILLDNPICEETGASENYCRVSQHSNPSYSTPRSNCIPVQCGSGQLSTPNCKCAYPYTGTLAFRAPSFSDLGNTSRYKSLEQSLMLTFQSHQLPVDSVSLSNPVNTNDGYLELSLQVFPSVGDSFNRTGISSIGFVLSNQTFKPPKYYGPFSFLAANYDKFSELSTGQKHSSNTGVIVGGAVGGSVLVLLLICAGIYALHQKKRAERATELNNPFASWGGTKTSGSVPQLKGARFFSFEELKKCTNNFSETNEIGFGGYGKVYRGTLASGQVVAIKRAQRESMQGGLQFKTEIELLSRVHHKNVVGLVGFCFEQGEQMLVYEYVPNGTLKENLSGKLGIRLDWMRRLKIALGSARGLAYLHELANPPIIHRDVKSTNILLDERLNAKVGDFGLSKPMGDSEKDNVTHVTTQVKGTMGYLDPEYYMTQQLTEKSDVYSFGVVMLELVTARTPIERGKYIVREVKRLMDTEKELYNLGEIIDPIMGTALGGLERFVDLAMRCVQESGSDRPTMGEVVKKIENIMELAGLNPNADSASTSESYEGRSKETFHHPYSDDSLFHYSGGFPPSKVEPQ